MGNNINGWEKVKVDDSAFSAKTMYRKEGYRIWRGTYRIISCIYSADEWHLQREEDHRIVYSAKTAKGCMEAFDRDGYR